MEMFGELFNPECREGNPQPPPQEWMEINTASGSTQMGNDCGYTRGLMPPSGDIYRHVIYTSYNILGMVMEVEFYTGITGEAAELDAVPNK